MQRFRHGFTAIPAMRELGKLFDRDPAQALAAARGCGFVIASELQAHGVDFTFAPVLDVDYGESGVIGDRALHSDPNVIATLAEALQAGLFAAGMTSVGKHFPGHGYVRADSHLEVPVDDRSLAEISAKDLVPFQRLARSGMGGVMPAHVIYPRVDAKPAGFSSVWLQKVLRDKLHFDGLVFSDDLSMEGASTAGGMIGARQRGAQRRLRHGRRLQRPARAGHDARGARAPPHRAHARPAPRDHARPRHLHRRPQGERGLPRRHGEPGARPRLVNQGTVREAGPFTSHDELYRPCSIRRSSWPACPTCPGCTGS